MDASPISRLPIELRIHVFELLDEDPGTGADLCASTLVSKAFNAAATLVLYQRVTLKTLPTLLARPALRRHAQHAFLDGRAETPSLEPDTDLPLPEEDAPGAKAALLARLCPALRTVHAVLRPADAARFCRGLPPNALPRVAAFQLRIAGGTLRRRARHTAWPSFGIDVLARLLALPALRDLWIESVLCDAHAVPQLPPAVVQTLALVHCQLSPAALAGVLAVTPRLERLALWAWPGLAGPHAGGSVDLVAVGTALLCCPALRALTLLLAGGECDVYEGTLTRLAELPRLARLVVHPEFLGGVLPASVRTLELVPMSGWGAHRCRRVSQ
jgi:hypothetical protein